MTTGQPGTTIWFTGLPCAGKSTLAAGLAERLPGPVQVLDGDVLRAEFFPELGFSQADRQENVRRAGRLALMMARHGITVLVPVIAPYRAGRAWVRGMHADAGVRFAEVWVDAPVEVCAERDLKGLYAKAYRGELLGLTGVDAPYEPPGTPELHLRTESQDLAECLGRLQELAGVAGVRS